MGEEEKGTVRIREHPFVGKSPLRVDATEKVTGRAVYIDLTIEGLAEDGKLHPLQKSAIEHGAVQCGFCTPGWLLSAKALLENNPSPTPEEVQTAVSGNLCRCTGYEKIVDSILAVAEGKMHKPSKPSQEPACWKRDV